jgi:signal transduction histidine kinase
MPLAVAGLWWMVPSEWATYLLLLAVLAVEWPFCISLADAVEVYFPVSWTSAGAAYVLGPVVLPIYWIAGVAGFALIVVLDGRRIVPAVGLAAESARRYRGQPYALDSVVDGDLRHFHLMSALAVRALAASIASATGLPLFAGVLVGELGVAGWDRIVPIPGRMAPARTRARVAAALGTDLVRATRLLDACVVCWLLLAWVQGGIVAFAGASLLTLALHAVLKRLSDTRRELENRQRLAVIGETASRVFHQLGRHHGAIGMYAHLIARATHVGGATTYPLGEHAGRILASLAEANRVMNDLLAFGQDRTLNLYRHEVETIVREAVEETAPRAAARHVNLRMVGVDDVAAVLDKHKIKQAVGNVLDNAIDASTPGAAVDVSVAASNGTVEIAIRDYGAGVAPEVRRTLFAPFVTTKPDGVGVGLALAKELVDAHGGRITWEPAEPGTRFVLALPRA